MLSGLSLFLEENLLLFFYDYFYGRPVWFDRVIFPQLLVRSVDARQAAGSLSRVWTCFRLGGWGEELGFSFLFKALSNTRAIKYLEKKMDTWRINLKLIKIKWETPTTRTLGGVGRFACDTAICMCGTPKYDSVKNHLSFFFFFLVFLLVNDLISSGMCFVMHGWTRMSFFRSFISLNM